MFLKSLPPIAKKQHGTDPNADQRVRPLMLAIALSIRATLLLLESHELLRYNII